MADQSFVADGKVTAAGIEELRKRLPYADVNAFASDPRVENINDLFTVGMVVKYLATSWRPEEIARSMRVRACCAHRPCARCRYGTGTRRFGRAFRVRLRTWRREMMGVAMWRATLTTDPKTL